MTFHSRSACAQHPSHPLCGQSWSLAESGGWEGSGGVGRVSGGVWRASGGGPAVVWRESGGLWQASVWRLEGVWRVSGGGLAA
eukprot:1182723-Prorocentrum_minimum.AAC.2